MGFIEQLKGLFAVSLNTRAQKEFDVKPLESLPFASYITKCAGIYAGRPYWVDREAGIKTVNMARTICSEIARLTVLGVEITVDGSGRGEYLQVQVDDLKSRIRAWVEFACAYGTIILKPNGEDVDLCLPDDFAVVAQKNGRITGAVFRTRRKSPDGKKTYIRLEKHAFTDEGYTVENKAFVSEGDNDDAGRPIPLTESPWKDLEEMTVLDIDRPLFAVLKMPQANNVDLQSPLGVPIFGDAIEELRDLDIAYSMNAREIEDSGRIVLMDSDRLIPTKGSATNADAWAKGRERLKLPRYVQNIMGSGEGDIYHEINPALNTPTRIAGIDYLLSQIGYKCGFSNGYFVFDQKSGMVTATQVESDDRRTIQLIRDVRDQLEACINDLVYALNVFADLEGLPMGEYEVTYNMQDLTANHEEDKLRWWGYVAQGKIPAWYFFNKFEGLSEDEAKALVEEAQPPMAPGLLEGGLEE